MTTYNHLAELRAKAKRCLGCNVPMIGISSTDRQKYCSPECSKDVKARLKNLDRRIVQFLGAWVDGGADAVNLGALFGDSDDYTLADAVRDALQG